MALVEKNDMGEVEQEGLEIFEIDGALLRDLLEEDENENGGHVNAMEESVDRKQQQEQQQQICVEQNECSIHDFEWLNKMELEPASLNDVLMNWYPEDMVGIGMVDFGHVNGECYSQVCEGLVFNEASYGCLWEDM